MRRFLAGDLRMKKKSSPWQDKPKEAQRVAANPAGGTQGRDEMPAEVSGAVQNDAMGGGPTPSPEHVQKASEEAGQMQHRPEPHDDQVHPGPSRAPRETKRAHRAG